MEKKIVNRYTFSLLVSLFFSQGIYAVAAYIPESVREYIVNIYKMNDQKVSSDFKELYSMLSENRIIASDRLVRAVVNEAYGMMKDTNRAHNEWRSDARACLQEYMRYLSDRSILLALKGDNDRIASFPNSLVARALEINARSRDMIYLSNELTWRDNLDMCADGEYAFERKYARTPTAIAPTSPSMVFNPNMLTSIISPTPNVIFGTGVSSPIINAWAMSPSSSVQSPINMQFSIPGSAKVEKGISLEMHLLMKKQDFVSGNVKIRINALYAQNSAEIAIDPMNFTYTNESPSFLVYESTDANSLVHMAIDIPIEKSGIDKMDFALISLTRVAPTGDEYQGDIYLASASFRYRS